MIVAHLLLFHCIPSLIICYCFYDLYTLFIIYNIIVQYISNYNMLVLLSTCLMLNNVYDIYIQTRIIVGNQDATLIITTCTSINIKQLMFIPQTHGI
jgi:hypothetical protein